MPYTIWCCLVSPIESLDGGHDDVDWDCSATKEVLVIGRNGLGELDYLFGGASTNLYAWKERTWALHSRTCIDQITFSFNIANSKLTVEARQIFN